MLGGGQVLFHSAVISTILITLADVVHTDTVGELKAQIADLENRLQRLSETVKSNTSSGRARRHANSRADYGGGPGTVYTRWGRARCDGPRTTLLYAGFAAGTHYTYNGGGANFQCMHYFPQYNNYTNRRTLSVLLSGVEYHTKRIPGIYDEDLHDGNVPCASCYAPRSAQVTIPGRRECPRGWTREYEGYLMTAWQDFNHPTTYECVDSDPRLIVDSSANTNGALLSFVVPQCGTNYWEGPLGHCPPYIEHRQITCVVCTK